MKKIFYYLRVVLCAFSCIAGVSLFFINSDAVSNFVVNALGLRLNPSMVGGEIAADFFDETCDDNGSGTLDYPHYSQFEKGSLDLVRYTVHLPVYEAVCQENPEYWQVDLEFKSGPADLRNIMIYIGADSIREGATEPLFGGAENVFFDAARPWNYAVWLNKDHGTVYNSDRKPVCRTEHYFKNSGREVLVRIPLYEKELRRLYAARNTWHYVVAGGFSVWDNGGFIPSDSDEKIYDLLDGPYTEVPQSIQLSGRMLVPVEVKLEKEQDCGSSSFESAVKERYNKYKEQAIVPAEETESEPEDFSGKLEYAVRLFDRKKTEEAERIFERLVAEDEGCAIANAYYGSCLAIRGGKSNVFAAMKLVKKSFVYLDKAVSLSAGTKDEMEVLLNRSSVASSVPESVFKKSAVAGADFERMAEIYRNSPAYDESSDEQKTTLAYYYVCAAENFRKAGCETDAKRNSHYAEKVFQKR